MTRRFFQYHPVIGHTYIPGLRGRLEHESGGVLLRVNDTGFRSEHEFVSRKEPGTFRVLVFGDSFTAGYGVRNEMRYTDVLEAEIPGLEVYNFGLDGTGPDQQYLIFREFAKDLEYDLIVIAPWVDNIGRSAATHQVYLLREGSEEKGIFPRPYFTIDAGSLELHQVPVPHGPIPIDELPSDSKLLANETPPIPRFAALRRLILRMGPRVTGLARRVTGVQPLPDYAEGHPSWLLLRAILARWVEDAQTPVLIAPIPLWRHVEGEADPEFYLRRFRELEDPPRVVVHDFVADLRKHPRKERARFHFEVDIHPTADGHRALAGSLAPPIRAAMARSSQREPGRTPIPA